MKHTLHTRTGRKLRNILAEETSELHIAEDKLLGPAKSNPSLYIELHQNTRNGLGEHQEVYHLRVQKREEPSFYNQAEAPIHVREDNDKYLLNTKHSLAQKHTAHALQQEAASIIHNPNAEHQELFYQKHIPSNTSKEVQELTDHLYIRALTE